MGQEKRRKEAGKTKKPKAEKGKEMSPFFSFPSIFNFSPTERPSPSHFLPSFDPLLKKREKKGKIRSRQRDKFYCSTAIIADIAWREGEEGVRESPRLIFASWRRWGIYLQKGNKDFF